MKTVKRIIEEANGMENKVQKRGSLWKKAVPTDDYHERLAFVENEDGTFSLNFKQIPALVHVSYDGNGAFDQTFLHGDYKAEAQHIKIESAVGELTSYTIDSLAVLKPVEETVFPEPAKTPQQIRDEIVAKAKADVAELTDEFSAYVGYRINYEMNKEKGVVVALGRKLSSGMIHFKGIAKADPSDCFNVHIGKAIALRRALGLEVLAEYYNAPAPTEVRVGDVVKWNYATTEAFIAEKVDGNSYDFKCALSGATFPNCNYSDIFAGAKVVDDSRE